MFPNKDDISAPLNYTNCLFNGVHSLYKLVAFSVTTYITILVWTFIVQISDILCNNIYYNTSMNIS